MLLQQRSVHLVFRTTTRQHRIRSKVASFRPGPRSPGQPRTKQRRAIWSSTSNFHLHAIARGGRYSSRSFEMCMGC